jgi:tetratricopeptide (TPR) repeat protein
VADVDEVIARLTARADEPDAPPLVLNLLARALRARWERTGDSIAIRHAIDRLTAAVARSPAGDPATSMYLNNLSAMWLRLHDTTGDVAALQSAAQYAQRALESCADGDPGRPMYANTAALAALRLSEFTDSDAVLAVAVQMSQTAADSTPDDHPDRASHFANLGVALAHAAIRSGGAIILDEAIEALESAVQIPSSNHPAYGSLLLNLGETLLIRGHAQDDDDTVMRGRDLIRQSASLAHLHAETAVRAARRWGNEAAVAGDWRTAATALRGAVERLAELPGHRLDCLDHEPLLVRLAGLATDTAAAYCAAGDDRSAVESLELGRCILLAKTLRDDHKLAALRHRDPILAARLAEVQGTLSAGPFC